MTIDDTVTLALRPRAVLEGPVRVMPSAPGRQIPAAKPADSGTEMLTAREVEILRLLAAGKSNPQIAEELFLSVKTVETHLRSVYKKLGVGSRGEAAHYAFTHGFA